MVGVAAEGSAIEAHGVTFDQIQFQVFSFVTYLLACILLIRTFTGKDQSRFLIHAATAFGIICFDHLLSGGIESIKLFNIVPPKQVNCLAQQTELLLSYLSTFFFGLTCILLWRYPEPSIQSGLYATLIGVLSGFVPLVIAIKEVAPPEDPSFLKTVDTVTSFFAILSIGFALISLTSRRKAVPIVGHKEVPIVGWIAATIWVIWSCLQWPFWLNFAAPENHQLYQYSLTFAGFASAIAMVIFSALALPDRQRYAGETYAASVGPMRPLPASPATTGP
jgi:hypothetical protein